MEAHEGILDVVVMIKLALDLGLVHVTGYGVVDVQQGYGIVADKLSDILGKCAVDIHLTGYRDAAGRQTSVHVAGNEAELGLECRPAFAGNDHVAAAALIGLDPVKQGQLILCKLLQNLRLLVTGTQLCCHVRNHLGDAGIARMLVVGFEKIQLGVLLNLDPQIVKRLDGCVACQEVLRTRTEADDLQVV